MGICLLEQVCSLGIGREEEIEFPSCSSRNAFSTRSSAPVPSIKDLLPVAIPITVDTKALFKNDKNSKRKELIRSSGERKTAVFGPVSNHTIRIPFGYFVPLRSEYGEPSGTAAEVNASRTKGTGERRV